MTRSAVTLAAVCLESLLLVACGASQPASTAAELPPYEPVAAPEHIERLQLPLTEFQLAPSQARAVEAATNRLVSSCLAAHGIRLELPVTMTDAHADRDFFALYEAPVRPLTALNASLGYRMPSSSGAPRDPVDVLPLPSVQVFRGWDEVDGPPRPTSPFLLDGGCLGQARRALIGNGEAASSQNGMVDDDAMYVSHLAGESAARALSDPRLAATITVWSSCMASHGYPGITSLMAAIRTWPAAGPVGEAELAQARQDVACKRQSGFTATYLGLLVAYQRQAVQRDFAHLARVKQDFRQLLARLARGDV